MKKILATVLLFITLITSGTLCHSEEFKPFEVKPLNYSYDSLEPYIDKETMMIHHDKHYKNYVDKLNAAIKKYPNLYSSSLTDLLTNLDSLPEEVSQTIKNNGGGVYNHEFFFDLMTSKKTIPCGELEKSINRDFGSLDKFKEEFKKAALDVFGSGWAWLVSDNNGNLSIVKTSNQDTPISQNLTPIIGIDVWEHAYYLRYQNNRANYIDNWFNVVNWNKALSNYNTLK